MGCGFSDTDWQSTMEMFERRQFIYGGCEEDFLQQKYTQLKIDGKNFAVHTIIYDDGVPGKKTLVMTHGYAVSCFFFSKIVKPLSEHYRIVMFDNLGWGLNTRVQNVGDALESAEKAEAWIVNFLETTIDALIEKNDIPEKFYLTGHSAGGHMAMVYASLHPERIEKLFLMSPPAENYHSPDFKYDIYNIRMQDNTPDVVPKKEVDKMIASRGRNEHMLSAAHSVPHFMLRSVFKGEMKTMLSSELFSAKEQENAACYYALMMQRHGLAEVVLMKTLDFFCYAKHDIHGPDRMGNPNIDFPIAFVFGDRDFFGTEGPDEIVSKNRYFATGESQIFKLNNSGHNVFSDNPKDCVKYMVGFFEGTIKGTYELKPKHEFTPARKWADIEAQTKEVDSKINQ